MVSHAEPDGGKKGHGNLCPVLATDLWLGHAILQTGQPFHPIGLPHGRTEEAGFDMPVFTTVPPTYAKFLEVRADRVAMVRGFLAAVTPDVLAVPREHPHNPARPETVRFCLHVILREEWEFSDRDAFFSRARPGQRGWR